VCRHDKSYLDKFVSRCANTKEQYRRNEKSPDAREATDALLRAWGLPPLTWGGSDLVTHGDVRQRYIAALRAADGQDYGPLREFLKQSRASS